ncbi:MAG: dihydroorotase [Acidimicrobiales bacterium]
MPEERDSGRWGGGDGFSPPDLLIRGGTIVDSSGSRRADVRVSGGTIAAVGPELARHPGLCELDAGGCVVSPGLVDLHAHLRQPGSEESETIASGGAAAALGGYTAVVAMPNTDPPIDCASVVQDVLALARGAACHVAVSGAITVGRAGQRLAPMAEMAALGVRVFTDDGSGVADNHLMRRALEYAAGCEAMTGHRLTLAQHCEDPALAAGGHMHEGEWSSRLGIAGVPAAAEEMMVARDLALLEMGSTRGARIHFQHLSTGRSVEMVRRAKAASLAVTAEAAPHHFTLTDAACAGFDPVFKVNPPLRPAADVGAVAAGLAQGVLDAVATDHAPHAAEHKERPFDLAPPGMLGLQTALPLALERLGEAGMSLRAILASMSWRPAAIAGLADHGGPIAVGRPAHLCVFDPVSTWVVDPSALASRSRNTPYAGRLMTGKVVHTVLGGVPTVRDAQLC